jgi:hypothetical protein
MSFAFIADGLCPPGWVERGGSCYFFYVGAKHLSYVDAQETCSGLWPADCVLASIYDAEENEFILNHTKNPNGSPHTVWIGLNSKLLLSLP